jgi:hypothetical protein
MLSTTTETTTAIRNYIIAAASIVLLSVGVADTFNSPARISQQDRLDNYGRVISAGLVSYAKTSLR